MTPQELTLPEHALCQQCHYALRGLLEPRCPECGRSFDPEDIETLHIATWHGSLARRYLKRASAVFYAWPLVAATLTLLAWEWRSRVYYGYETWNHVRLPRWTGIAGRTVELLPIVVALWAALFFVWLVRIAARRSVVAAFRLPPDRLARDRRPRQFAAWCFLLTMLVIGPHTDRCTHGEYWEMWRTIGIERDVVGGFCTQHASACVPLGRGWHLYWRR